MRRKYIGGLTLGVSVVAFITCASLLLIGGTNADHSDEGQSAVDYQDIAAHLVQRRDASMQGVIAYRHYTFRVDADAFDDLVQLLENSQGGSQEVLFGQAESWLNTNLPSKREVWIGSCAFLQGEWLDQKQRDVDLDTIEATMQALADAEGATAMQTVRNVFRHSDGVTTTSVEDGRNVRRHQATEGLHPLVPSDVSLNTWQDAIDLGANVEGQQIFGFLGTGEQTIQFHNTLPDGTWVAADYTFCPAADWAPIQVRIHDPNGTSKLISYGCPATDGTLIRPRVIAKGTARADGDVDAWVAIIDQWADGCDEGDVYLRLPAMYLLVDHTGDPSAPPEVHVVEPSYLTNIALEDKLEVALGHVLNTLGTGDAESDFAFDGIVDQADIAVVFQRFAGGQ